MRLRAGLLLAALAALPASAVEIAVPGGQVTVADASPATSVRLPDRPWAEGAAVNEVEGAVRRRAIRAGGSTLTVLQLMVPIREALEAEGYEIVFDCADVVCGGFDFRFQLDILGEPQMHVDLGDYRYLLAQKPEAGEDEARAVSVVASRGRDAGYVHVTEVFAAETAPEAAPLPSVAAAVPKLSGDLAATLEAAGHAVLSDLDFGSGASDLGAGPYDSLTALADWLAANPAARVVIVGHTDSVGSLEANTALSRRRAEAVRGWLTGALGADPGQIIAEGAGYLAPVASNLTEAGRALNRRVEVVLLSVDP
jgi:OOP family OmpA-OmpF porin